MNIIDFSTKYKLNININKIYIESQFIDFDVNVISSTIVETGTFILATYLTSTKINILYDLLYFIPISFIFEIIFDFFHYWSHRMMHTNKFLYKYFHKRHHLNIYPTTILTFYHNPIDLILTNSIPFLLTLYILSNMHLNISIYTMNILTIYKTYIEISGHIGKRLYPSGSFPQFIWLPKFFDIQLFTEDHDIHHSHTNYNYSKRFILWDKVFHTKY
jgi:sterol desaturase/sphingolipid hydroxylase (fatty acid hydroxylase superfamily)